jgi:hypothetical protein
MELLLNLIWISLAILALLGSLRSRRLHRTSRGKSLLALACGVVLLFPVISASDDLHPTEAVMEEASKRVQLTAASLHPVHVGLPPFMLAATLALCLMCLPVLLQPFHPLILKTLPLSGTVVPSAGRAPPSCWN